MEVYTYGDASRFNWHVGLASNPSVCEQSGIRVDGCGFGVKVKGNTGLKGSVITSPDC